MILMGVIGAGGVAVVISALMLQPLQIICSTVFGIALYQFVVILLPARVSFSLLLCLFVRLL